MGNLTFKAKYKVICTECSRDEFEQADEEIRCVHCGTKYKRPDTFHIEPFDVRMNKAEEH